VLLVASSLSELEWSSLQDDVHVSHTQGKKDFCAAHHLLSDLGSVFDEDQVVPHFAVTFPKNS
jgi:hypothetical protein